VENGRENTRQVSTATAQKGSLNDNIANMGERSRHIIFSRMKILFIFGWADSLDVDLEVFYPEYIARMDHSGLR